MKRQLAIISIFTAAAQLAAFIKLRFTARIFGVGPELDGYNLALVLPTLISGVLTGVLQTGLFPVRAKINSQGDPEAVQAFERSVLLVMCSIGCVIAFVLAVTSGLASRMLSTSEPASVKVSLTFALPIVSMMVALNLIGDCTGFLLAMRNRFVIAAGAPVMNGILGALLLAAWPSGRLLNLVIGTVLGLTLQVAICVWGLHRSGFRFIGALPKWAHAKELWSEVVSLGAWILPGVVFSNLIASLPPVWVAKFGEGAVSAFGYGYRLHTSAVQLIVMASSTVILARLSDLIAQRDDAAVRSIFKQAALFSAALGIIAVIAVWSIGSLTLQWVFGGRFDALAAHRVSEHWLWLTAGLPFTIMGNVLAKLWQAQGKPLLMTLMASGTLVSVLIFFSVLQPWMGEYAVSGALTAGAIVTLVAGCFVTRRTLFSSGSKQIPNHHC